MKREIISFLALILLGGCAPQPEKPLELRLTIAKSKIQSGEYPWYLFEVTNVGRKPVFLQGEFWHNQDAIQDLAPGKPSQSKFRLEIEGPEGWDSSQLSSPWGFHGEFKFWTNDCGGAKSCKGLWVPCRARGWPWSKIEHCRPYKILQGGETWPATPSMVAPIRPRDPNAMDDPGDMRALPSIPKEWSSQKVQAMQKWWKHQVESTGHLMGEPGFLSDQKEGAVDRPRGYRVLDLYMFDMPGRYRMRFIHTPGVGIPTRPDATKEEIREAKESLILSGWPKETKYQWYYTNWVEFEVVPSSFPKHLFKPSLIKNPRRSALTDRLEKVARESQIWAEDTPEERSDKQKMAKEAAQRAREKDAKIKVLMRKYSEPSEK